MAGKSTVPSPVRRWQKQHLALDSDSGEIIAHVMTDQGGDATPVEALLDKIGDQIGHFTADGLMTATGL